MKLAIQLPKRESIAFPSNLESSPHIYYSVLLGKWFTGKLEHLCRSLPDERMEKILEIGFGSGIALKELGMHAAEVYGIDVHDHVEEVEAMLRKEGVKNVRLLKHDIFREPFPAQSLFDCVFASSVLEHIPREALRLGFENIRDILKAKGLFLVGFPRKGLLMNSVFGLYEATYKKIKGNLYDFSHKEDHPSSQKEILPELERCFRLEQIDYYPNAWLKLYMIVKCRKV